MTGFHNTVVWVAPGSSGFKMRSVLIRAVPYFCLGYGNVVPGGNHDGGGGAPPAIGTRDKATTAALKGHAGRTANWTAGAMVSPLARPPALSVRPLVPAFRRPI